MSLRAEPGASTTMRERWKGRPNRRCRHLRAAKDLMDRAYVEPLNLDEIARRAGYSRFHFLRSIRDAYGESPRAYLTRRHLDR